MNDLGDRIRKLRVRQRLTLKQIAGACGVTTSLLSKIENGKAFPSVATLTRIAEALGVRMSALLDAPRDQTTVVSTADADERQSWTKTDKGYRFQALCGGRLDKVMQPLLFVAERGKIKQGTMRHGGEEFVFVLEGRMSYRVGRTTRELGPGDAIYFDAEDPHDLRPITAKVKYLAVFADAHAPRRGGKGGPA